MGNVQSHKDLERLMTRRDSVSGTFDVILTYAMSHLTPKHIVSDLATLSGRNLLNDLMRVTLKSYMNMQEGKVECMKFNSGSTAEGLSLLQFRMTDSGSLTMEPADIDVLMIDNYYFSTTQEKAIETKCDGYIDTSQTYPGFVRLKIVDTTKLANELVVKRMQNGEEVKYLSKVLLQSIRSDEPGSKTGPAATSEATADINVQGTNVSKEFPGESSVDIVYAVNLIEWPDFIKKWQSRQTEVPNLGMFLDKNFGCYLVGAAHPNSEDPELEWRISLSVPELILARELTVAHRQAYLVFKYLVKELLKGQKGIVTYHLKTTLFWTIENSPPDMWSEENLAQCLYQLLDTFINFLAQKKLPNYFIPESNLLGHLSIDFVETTLSSILKLREDPLGHLLKFQRYIRLQGHSIWWDHAFEVILHPHLEMATRILSGYNEFSESSIMLLRRCLFESMVDVIAFKMSEEDFLDPQEMMMTYISLPAVVRPEPSDLPFEDLLYNFLVHVCGTSFQLTGNADIVFAFLAFVQRRLEASIEMTVPIYQRLTLLEAVWNHIRARYAEDFGEADRHLEQNAVVLDKFSLHQDDVITIAEYSCFFFQLWCRRFKGQGTQALVTEVSKSLKVLHTLLFALEIRNPPQEYQFYGIWKLLSFGIKQLEPNFDLFLESSMSCYVPHEIIALFANLLTIRKVLIPSIDSMLLKTRNDCQCEDRNPPSSCVCDQAKKAEDLMAFKEIIGTLMRSAETLLFGVVMVFNGRIMNLNFNVPGNRQMSKICVNFFLALAMMYARCWDSAASVLSSICALSQPTDQVLWFYQKICVSFLTYNKYNDMAFRKALLPMATFHGSNFKILMILKEFLANRPSPLIQSHSSRSFNPRVSISTYGKHGVKSNPITMKVKLRETPIEIEVSGNEITIINDGISSTYPYDKVTDNVEDIFQKHIDNTSSGFAEFSGLTKREIIEELSARLASSHSEGNSHE